MNRIQRFKKNRGFTLTEVMIVVALIGILASVAYPSYSEFVLRSNRTEAQRELMRLANLQEQRFVDWRSYANSMSDLGVADPYTSPSGHYGIGVITTASGFTLTATAKNAQLKDTQCLTLTINEIGQKGGTSSNCWEK